MQIRTYAPSDLPVLRAMTVEAFDGVSIDQSIEQLFGEINGHDWRWRKARHVDADAARDPAGIFVLDAGGRIAGYISTWMDREAGIGHIPNLVLHPDYRGQGLGRRLIQHALDHFRSLGLGFAKIETLAQNEVGNGLYRSMGFQEIVRQIHFVADLNAVPASPSAGD